MASLHRHSSGRSPYYFCKFRGPDGRVVVKSTKQKKWADAAEVCNKWERVAKLGAQGSLSEAQARKVVGEIFEVATGEPLEFATTEPWMNDWLADVKATRAPGTYLRYRLTIERFLKFIGRKAKGNLANVRKGEIQGFRDAELKAGVSASSADLTVKTLRIPFNLARRQGIITVNPAEGVTLLNEGGQSRDAFSEDQVRSILNSAKGEWSGVIRYGYYTGARLGNCVHLRWDQVDLVKEIATYTQEKRKRGAKSKPVIIPLHPALAQELSSRRRLRAKSHYVFPLLATQPISGKTGLSSQFAKIMAAAGIIVPTGPKRKGRGRQFRRLGFHSLKHTFISGLAAGKVSPDVRKALVGHKSDEVHDIYTHIDLPSLVAAIGHLPSV